MRRTSGGLASLALSLCLAGCAAGGGRDAGVAADTGVDVSAPELPDVAASGAEDAADSGPPLVDAAEVAGRTDAPGDAAAPDAAGDGADDSAGDVRGDAGADVADAADAREPCRDDDDCRDLLPSGDLCLVASCEDGVCDVHQKPCDDEEPCTLDVCNPQSGACVHPCNPACGGCHGCEPGAEDPVCSDRNPCTLDVFGENCDGCVHTLRDIACLAGNPCSTGARCQPAPAGSPLVAICAGGVPMSCDDGDPCTLDWCEPTAGGNPCRHIELEYDGCEQGAPIPCGETEPCPVLTGNPCVVFECDRAAGTCSKRFPTSPCDDGEICTTEDRCSDGRCVGGPPLDCDDGDPHTIESCVPGEGCVRLPPRPPARCVTVADCDDETSDCRLTLCHEGYCVTPDTGGACDDGDFCTVDDACDDGVCAPGAPRDCASEPDLDCAPECPPVCDSTASACVCGC